MSLQTVILGGGLAGLSAAYHLRTPYTLFEARSQFGGIAGSFSVDGFTFDHAIHILFTRDPYASEFIRTILADNFEVRERSSWLYSYGTMTPYPYQANMRGLPRKVIAENLIGLARARIKRRSTKSANFEEWILANFGAGIAKHCMLPLNEKVWGVHPRSMSTDWMDDRVPRTKFRDVLSGLRRNDDRGRFGTNGTFWYPKRGGMGALTEGIRRQVQNLHSATRCVRIDATARTLTFADASTAPYDILITSIPLHRLIDLLGEVPQSVSTAARSLKWNTVHTVVLGIDRPNISNKHWIYFPEREVLFQRISFPMNFADDLAPSGTSSIMAEITSSTDRPIERDSVTDRTIEQLRKIGMVRSDDRILTRHCVTIEPAYVIYDWARPQAVRIIHQYLHGLGIIPCGRFGDWEYLNMDQTILSGRRAAEMVHRVHSEHVL